MKPTRETELYPPVKSLLEGQGYEVKAEVGSADVVAIRGDEPPVIVELKLGFSLSLFHQAVARQAITDDVYIAVPRVKGKRFQKSLKDNIALCRRLGIGLITVRLGKNEVVEIHLDPEEFKPRKSKLRQGRLLREFARRVGDPNAGGATRVGLVTAYRQDAILCARFLKLHGPSKGSVVAAGTDVSGATRMMAADHYGWFERVETGIYAITPKGLRDIESYEPKPEPCLGAGSDS